MDRRNFIKTIAAATTAPLALLKAEPTLPEINHPPEEGVFEGFTWIPSHKPAAPFIELEAGEVYKSKVYDVTNGFLDPGWQSEAMRLAKQVPSRFQKHVTSI